MKVRELGNAGKSRLETLMGLGVTPVNVGVPADGEDRVNASRQLIPVTLFDGEKCSVGLDRLTGYRKRWNRATSSYTGPLHDQNSHGADAFGEFAVNRSPEVLARQARSGGHTQGGWMR